MLSLFPELLFLSPLAALLIRLSVAGVFAYSAWQRLPHSSLPLKIFGAIDGLLAVLLVAGAYTQAAAVAGIVCTTAWLALQGIRPLPRSTVILALILCLSLLLTGPGVFAFDLPL